MGKRRKGREIVLQSCYASLVSGADLAAVLDDQIERRESAAETVEFARQLVARIQGDRAGLEAWLSRLVTGAWRPERLGMLEKVILVMGLAELRHSREVPFRVVINEALELTRRYCDEDAVGFVNGVLDKAAAEIHAPTPKTARTPEGDS